MLCTGVDCLQAGDDTGAAGGSYGRPGIDYTQFFQMVAQYPNFVNTIPQKFMLFSFMFDKDQYVHEQGAVIDRRTDKMIKIIDDWLDESS